MVKVLEVAHFSTPRQADQFVKLQVGKVLGAGVAEDTPPELCAKVQVVYGLILEGLLHQV